MSYNAIASISYGIIVADGVSRDIEDVNERLKPLGCEIEYACTPAYASDELMLLVSESDSTFYELDIKRLDLPNYSHPEWDQLIEQACNIVGVEYEEPYWSISVSYV